MRALLEHVKPRGQSCRSVRGWSKCANGCETALERCHRRQSNRTDSDTVTGEACEIDILKEIFHRPPTLTDAGPTLSRDDAVGLKVRALHDRGFPRDVIDVFSARELYTIGELERLGAQHDEEFDLEELHGRLEAVDFTSDREYAAYGMSPEQIIELRAWVQDWLDDLGLRLAEPYDEDEDSG